MELNHSWQDAFVASTSKAAKGDNFLQQFRGLEKTHKPEI